MALVPPASLGSVPLLGSTVICTQTISFKLDPLAAEGRSMFWCIVSWGISVPVAQCLGSTRLTLCSAVLYSAPPTAFPSPQSLIRCHVFQTRLPCGHCTMCEECATIQAEAKAECPLCRCPFDDWWLCNGMATFYGKAGLLANAALALRDPG